MQSDVTGPAWLRSSLAARLMNFFELLMFLVVTGALGALVGLAAGSVAGFGAKWAGAGALAGPIVAAFGISIWISIRKVIKARKQNQDEKS